MGHTEKAEMFCCFVAVEWSYYDTIVHCWPFVSVIHRSDLWCFLCCLPERVVEQRVDLSIILKGHYTHVTALEWCRICAPVIKLQYIPRNMHTVFVLLCFVVVIHWLVFPYPSGLLHWHCGNLTIAPVPAKQPWWIWINTSCEFIMNDCITTTKQSTTKPCAYFLGYTVWCLAEMHICIENGNK